MSNRLSVQGAGAAAFTMALAMRLATPGVAMASADGPTPAWPDRIEWADDGPAAREHPSLMVFGDTVVIYAGSGYAPQGAPLGDAWAFDLREASWRALEIAGDAPDAAGSRRVAQPRGEDHAYLFGGYGGNFATNNDLHRARLEGDALVFERIEQIDPPPARALHAFAADSQTGALIVSHGVSAAGFFDDTWIGVFDGEGRVTWTELSADDAPGPRFGFAFGFDADRGELLMLSGQTPPTQENPMPMAQGLWTLEVRSDPPAWRRVEVAGPPVGRRNPMYAFDDASDTLVVWCGTADARTNVPGLVVVSRDEQGEWRVAELSDGDAPARRSSGVGFTDPRSDRFFLGFGNSREGQYTDWVTLALDGAVASEVSVEASEPVNVQAVEAAIREYVTAKYAGDDEVVRSRAHHDIARRVVATNYRGRPSDEWIRPYDHDRLQFYGTSRNGTRCDDPKGGRCEITVHDLETGSAAAVVVMEDVVDFLHLAQFDGRWLIVDSAVIILDENGAAPPPPTRQGAPEIERIIHDYCMGFYEMNGPKVQATCHPILSKRTVERWSEGAEGAGFDYFRPITWEEIRLLGDAFNREFGFDPATARCDIEVYEIREKIALAKLTGAVWFDYLQLMRINGEWTIVNILFEPLSAARSESP
ncbi:MAG: nuclear transport factor 2 family protein [Phycisphaerales bacterium]